MELHNKIVFTVSLTDFQGGGELSGRCWRKYIFGFSKSAPTPRYTILDSRLPPCNVISEGSPPLSNTGSEARALPQEVRIENDSDLIFSKSKFVHCFLETTFLHVSLQTENILIIFRSLHLPLDTQFWTRGFPLVMRSRKAGLPLATRARKRELCP